MTVAPLVQDTEDFERWLAKHCALVKAGLKAKHERMAGDAFIFFRATSYRFARTILKSLPDLESAPAVGSVGDAHVGNWGTWRDAEGRLVFGVNDFDDAYDLPYTYDLVRLAASTRFATNLPGSNKDRVAAILTGYRQGLVRPGPCFVHDQGTYLQMLADAPVTPGAFATALRRLPAKAPPPEVADALRSNLPEGTSDIRFGTHQRGVGSLGVPRYVAAGVWRGGPAAREAKALVPSAWSWALGDKPGEHRYLALADGPHRSPDRFLTLQAGFIIRRIAHDSGKLDWNTSTAREHGLELLQLMGADLASVHASAKETSAAILGDLKRRPQGWLHVAAKTAGDAAIEDYRTWCSRFRKA